MNQKLIAICICLVIAGGALRVVAGVESLGFVHPDEHQQYLEAANKIAYGYGIVFWEYDRGIRHYLYPGALAGFLRLLETAGIGDPIVQAKIIRTTIGLSVFGSLALFALCWIRQGKRVAGLSLLAMSALSPFLIFVGARTLSETAVIPLLVLMLFFLDFKPLVSGLLAGLMFAVRFQSALFVAPLFIAMAGSAVFFEDHRRERKHVLVRFGLGLLASLLFVGLVDCLTWGAWFHSPIEYFRANVLEDVASMFGVSPWHQYLRWIWDAVQHSSVLIIPLIALSFRSKPHWALAAVLFVVAHSCIGHKEARFIWPMIPVMLLLVAEGLEIASQHLVKSKIVLSTIVSISLLYAIVVQFPTIDWHMGFTESSSRALSQLRTVTDVEGVAVVGHPGLCGNYFYLRRNDVPFVVSLNWVDLPKASPWKERKINYLIAPFAPDVSAEFEVFADLGDLFIFRVRHPLESSLAKTVAR